MKTYRIATIPGDGIGKEVVPAGQTVLAALAAADGSFAFSTVRPVSYKVPDDGPAGDMLRILGRDAWRPAHLHFMISAPGYKRLITHIFRNGDRYLDSDAVFGVRQRTNTSMVPDCFLTVPVGVAMPIPPEAALAPSVLINVIAARIATRETATAIFSLPSEKLRTIPSSLFLWLAGLAVGLALKEQRYLADASDSPLDRCPLGPPFSAFLWRRFSRRFGKISKRSRYVCISFV